LIEVYVKYVMAYALKSLLRVEKSLFIPIYIEYHLFVRYIYRYSSLQFAGDITSRVINYPGKMRYQSIVHVLFYHLYTSYI